MQIKRLQRTVLANVSPQAECGAGRGPGGRRCRIGCRPQAIVSLLAVLILSPVGSRAAEDIPVNGCFIRVLEKADVSAMERGVIRSIAVRPGRSVSDGNPLAVLDDTRARLALQQAQQDLAIAEKQHRESQAIQLAEAELKRAEGQLQEAVVEAEIADRVARTDLAVLIAQKDAERSEDELNRLKVARSGFGASVSEQRLVQAEITHAQNQMKVQQAQHDHKLNELRSNSRRALIEQREAARDKLKLELIQARVDHEVMELTLKNLRTAVAAAEDGVRRRNLTSPLNGVVVEQLRQVGEWVEPGETIFRIIRLDQLAVEGFVDAAQIRAVEPGASVRIVSNGSNGSTTLPGNVTFISREVDPLNRQVLIRAEFTNTGIAFWPGQSAEVTLLPNKERAVAEPTRTGK
jgi:multidrug resistance efflux pump